ncbi:MAG: VIT1/CCC1 transporter family protein [Halobacteria archaeon]
MFDGLVGSLGESGMGSISRRYFISNGFDGTLTCIGITVSSYLTGVGDGVMVIKIALGAAVGLGTSGVWSVWEIEKAERLAEIHEIEDAMLEKLEDTRLERQKQKERKFNAVMSGLGPLIGILVPVLPFLFEGGLLSMLEATTFSVALGVAVLFTFGAYMSTISRQRWYVAGVRMGLAGLVVGVINILLPG